MFTVELFKELFAYPKVEMIFKKYHYLEQLRKTII